MCNASLNPAHQAIARRPFMVQLAALALTLAPACSSTSQSITIGLHPWAGYEPTPLARAMGWLDEKLVRLVETTSATESLRLLEQGKIDGAGLTLDEVLRARARGIALSVILVCDVSAGADMLLARPGIPTLAELRGRRIGAEQDATGAVMLHRALHAGGLARDDIVLVPLTVNQHPQAWENREIDAVVTYEPAATRIAALGGVRLFDSRQMPETIVDVLAVRTNRLDANHTAALRHLVAMHLKALKHLHTNPEDAAYRIAPRLQLPPSQVASVFKGLVLPDLDNNLRLLAAPAQALAHSASVVASVLHDAGMLHGPTDLTDLLRPEFLAREAP